MHCCSVSMPLHTCMASSRDQCDKLAAGLEEVSQAFLDLVHDGKEGRVHVAQKGQTCKTQQPVERNFPSCLCGSDREDDQISHCGG